jgi:hypothetical protein
MRYSLAAHRAVYQAEWSRRCTKTAASAPRANGFAIVHCDIVRSSEMRHLRLAQLPLVWLRSDNQTYDRTSVLSLLRQMHDRRLDVDLNGYVGGHRVGPAGPQKPLRAGFQFRAVGSV